MKTFTFRALLLAIVSIVFVHTTKADTIPVDRALYTILDYSSTHGTNIPDRAIDGDSLTTFWNTKGADPNVLPAYISFDLGSEKAVTGFHIIPQQSPDGAIQRRVSRYKVYISNDPAAWGDPVAESMIIYDGILDKSPNFVYFGAATGQYVKLHIETNYLRDWGLGNDQVVKIADLQFYEDTDGATTLTHSIVKLDTIETLKFDEPPFDISATTNSDAPVQYEILSGPATINGNTITLTGETGKVFVKAFVEENANYTAAYDCFIFEVGSDIVEVPMESIRIVDYNSSHPTGAHVRNAFDNDSWSQYGTNKEGSWGTIWPAWVVVDLGSERAVAGLKVNPSIRNENAARRRPSYIDVWVSNDSLTFGDTEYHGLLVWDSISDPKPATALFGATSGQFVKFAWNRSYWVDMGIGNDMNTVVSRVAILEDTTGASGKTNPVISVTKRGVTGNIVAPFAIEASVDTDQTLNYEVLHGPATMDGNVCTLTGEEGVVFVSAFVEESATHNAGYSAMMFKVVDVSQFHPAIKATFSSEQSIHMKELIPYRMTFYVDSLPEYVSVEETNFTINGESIEVIEFQNGYYADWQPDALNEYHEITINVTAANGNTDTKTYNVYVTDWTEDIFDVEAIDSARIIYSKGGQYKTVEASLPQFIGAYDSIVGRVSVTCPDNGCDPYDRISKIWVQSANGPWVEIIRYATPFGVECDDNIDLSDYASLLQGKVKFKIWIQTWGDRGWDLHLDLDYYAGTPEYNVINVEPLWSNVFNFGNYANLQPVPEKKVVIDTNVATTKLTLVTTGHGWHSDYNTDNAAEFYEAFHDVYVNANKFPQHLYNQCDPNPADCSPQMGTWYHPRAGWCPGSVAKTFEYDLSEHFNYEDNNVDTATVVYKFEETYVDLCHPNHPDCTDLVGCDTCDIGDVVCPDCQNATNAQPNYQVAGNFFKYLYNYEVATPPSSMSNEFPIEDLTLKVYPTAGDGNINIKYNGEFENATLELITIDGRTHSAHHFNNASELNNYQFDYSYLPNGTYYIMLRTDKGFGTRSFLINK